MKYLQPSEIGSFAMDLACHRLVVRQMAVCLICVAVPSMLCQTPSAQDENSPATGGASRAMAVPVTPPTRPAPEQLPRHIFGIIPNYRSHASLQDSKPLTTGQKFKLAARDSFDPGTFLLAGMIAGVGLASDSTPSYGHGLAGYGRYYGSTYGDLFFGNMMTEAVYPSLLHQDPRYFRKGGGSAWSRLEYAVSQIFITHGDNRRTQFNFSELGGNATAVAISNAYNPDNRSAAEAASRLGVQLGLDMAGNILKEFGPDLHKKLFGKKHAQYSGAHP